MFYSRLTLRLRFSHGESKGSRYAGQEQGRAVETAGGSEDGVVHSAGLCTRCVLLSYFLPQNRQDTKTGILTIKYNDILMT